MNSEFLNCPVCYDHFDENEHLPHIIPHCGHTICSTCLSTILRNSREARCPLDKKKFSSQQTLIEDFPVNIVVTQLYKEQYSPEFCKDHHEENTFICLNDGHKLCDICIGQGVHKGHKIKPLKVIKHEINAKKKEITSLRAKVSVYHQELDDEMKNRKNDLLDTIKQKFEEIRKIILEKEEDLVFEVNSIFYKKKSEIDFVLGNNSLLKRNLDKKASELSRLFEDEGFLRDPGSIANINESIASYTSKIDSISVSENISKLRKEFDDINQSLHRTFSDQITAWSGLDLQFSSNASFSDDFILQLSDNYGENSSEDVKSPNNTNPLSVITHLNLKHTGNNLEINLQANQGKKICNIDPKKWINVDDIKLDLAKPLPDENDLSVLSQIWRSVKNPKTIKLKFGPDTINDNLSHLLLQGISASFCFDFSLDTYNIAENSHIAIFVAKMLHKMRDIKQLWLRMNKSEVSKQDIDVIFRKGVASLTSLESFSLFLDQVELTDYSVQNAFIPLPGVKIFILCMNKAAITDKSMELLTEQTIKSMTSLEEFQIYLHKTQVTDSGFKNMFADFKNIRKLSLDLGFTKITDETVILLSHAVKQSADTLETFQIGFASTQVNDESICQLLCPMPNVKFFTLGLSLTNITDKCLDTFVANTLPSMKSLEHLNMWLNKTNISDNGIQKVFRNVPDMEIFALDLDSTKVTNRSIEPFIKDKLPVMKSLKRFRMDLVNTSVTREIKAQVENLTKKISESKR